MNSGTSPQPPPPFNGGPSASRPPTTRWQAALVAISLAALSLFVVLPAASTLLFLGAFLLAFLGAHALAAMGALESNAYSGAIHLACALLIVTAAVATLQTLADSGRWARVRIPPRLRKLSTRFAARAASTPAYMPAPVPPPRRPLGRWLLRHPWSALAGLLVLLDVVLIPIDRSRLVDLPDGIIGALILATLAMLEIGMAYALWKGFWTILRAVWASSRRSPFVAGAVAAGCTAVSFSAYLVYALVLAVLAALPAPAPPPETALCRSSALECSRELLTMAAAGGRPRGQLDDLVGAVSAPSSKRSLDDCIREIHSDDPARGNAYADALKRAKQVLPGRPDDAEDVVRETLLAVCVREEIRDVRAYFIKSVDQNAWKTARRNRRFCSIVPESPEWPVEGCLARSLEQRIIQSELEVAVHDALCRLSAQDKKVIQLYAWDGLSHAEVARDLGCSEVTARKRYSRALDALKEEFHKLCR